MQVLAIETVLEHLLTTSFKDSSDILGGLMDVIGLSDLISPQNDSRQSLDCFCLVTVCFHFSWQANFPSSLPPTGGRKSLNSSMENFMCPPSPV